MDRNLITAKAARDSVNAALKTEFSNQVGQLKQSIDLAINEAIESGKYCAVAKVPADIELEILQACKTSLQKLGYKTRIDTVHGIFQEGLIRGPQTTLTIWF